MPYQSSIQSQYTAALAMFEQAVNECPEELWDRPSDVNAVWQVAYHALFFTHLYLQPDGKDFVPWAKHRDGYHDMNVRENPYSQAEIREYLAFVRNQVNRHVPALDLDGPSGFGWLPFNKLELQFYNLRHLQHHTGELAERLGRAGVSVKWVSRGD